MGRTATLAALVSIGVALTAAGAIFLLTVQSYSDGATCRTDSSTGAPPAAECLANQSALTTLSRAASYTAAAVTGVGTAAILASALVYVFAPRPDKAGTPQDEAKTS